MNFSNHSPQLHGTITCVIAGYLLDDEIRTYDQNLYEMSELQSVTLV